MHVSTLEQTPGMCTVLFRPDDEYQHTIFDNNVIKHLDTSNKKQSISVPLSHVRLRLHRLKTRTS